MAAYDANLGYLEVGLDAELPDLRIALIMGVGVARSVLFGRTRSCIRLAGGSLKEHHRGKLERDDLNFPFEQTHAWVDIFGTSL